MTQAYKKVIVIGYGAVTADVVKHVYSLRDKYGYTCEYIEHEVHSFNMAKSFCGEASIECSTIESREELTQKLTSIGEKTLIISASNNYLFPTKVVDNDFVTIINFHNALLPKFPGRNAPSWVIYEGERTTGITWHYVTSRVDAGNIIIQKEIPIDADIKAYELAGALMNLAYEAFAQIIEDVLCDKASSMQQAVSDNRKMYLSKDVPGDGCFDVHDSWEDIYRLLRATDYAKYDIFPPVTTVVEGKKVRVIRYKIVDIDKVKKEEGFLSYIIDDEKALQIKYKNLD